MPRIPFRGGPLDGAIIEMAGVPMGPIGIALSGEGDSGGALVVSKTGPVYWYDWSAGDDELIVMNQTVRDAADK